MVGWWEKQRRTRCPGSEGEMRFEISHTTNDARVVGGARLSSASRRPTAQPSLKLISRSQLVEDNEPYQFDSSRSRSSIAGVSLIETLVYMALLFVVLGLAFES